MVKFFAIKRNFLFRYLKLSISRKNKNIFNVFLLDFQICIEAICILLGCRSHFFLSILYLIIFCLFSSCKWQAASVCFGGTLPRQYDWAFGHRRAANMCLPWHLQIVGHLRNGLSAVARARFTVARCYLNKCIPAAFVYLRKGKENIDTRRRQRDKQISKLHCCKKEQWQQPKGYA